MQAKLDSSMREIVMYSSSFDAGNKGEELRTNTSSTIKESGCKLSLW